MARWYLRQRAYGRVPADMRRYFNQQQSRHIR